MSASRTQSPQRILLVEDERSLSTAVRRGLEADGYEVEIADDGTDGLRLARSGGYAALLLDVMLPGIGGFEICRLRRAENDSTPILMLTARDADADQVEALELGADDYLTKPFSYPVLLARLRALLRRAAGDGGRVELRVGDLRMDSAARRAWRGETELELSPRALTVLEFLMRHPGAVISKQELLENVWDVGFDGDPNIVEVYISRLRKAIDAPFGRSSVQTVRGGGYRLDAGEN